MAKFLALVEVDTTLPDGEQDVSRFTLTGIADHIGGLGEHVTVEKFVNLESIERIEGVQVWEAREDATGEPLPSVPIVQTKFSAGQYVDVILLPGDRSKTLHLTAIIRKEEDEETIDE